ncbi:MAG: hypothetical protein JXQ73_15930 [Phycisphaerae bacterium]|nr:hypothetical protein [Phycisphaerae bacterium]
MSEDSDRLIWLPRAARWLLYVALVAGFVFIIFGFYLTATLGLTGASIVLVGVGATVILVCALGFGIVVALTYVHAELHRTRRALLTMMDVQRRHFGEQQSQLEVIAENALLSDATKSLAHREKERAALRTAIREDITREDWDTAYSLIEQMSTRYGYKDEAERFREEVEESRRDALESKVNMAIQQVEELFESNQWERARAEVRRLLGLYPDHERIKVLPDRLETSFTGRKDLLRRQFQEAADRKEVDRSIELVKELDMYLTPQEAKELEGVVRMVFQDKLDNLTVEFELAVHEQRWPMAISVAKQIMSEYPNTRRAQELRDGVFDSLLKRGGIGAGEVQAS